MSPPPSPRDCLRTYHHNLSLHVVSLIHTSNASAETPIARLHSTGSSSTLLSCPTNDTRPSSLSTPPSINEEVNALSLVDRPVEPKQSRSDRAEFPASGEAAPPPVMADSTPTTAPSAETTPTLHRDSQNDSTNTDALPSPPEQTREEEHRRAWETNGCKIWKDVPDGFRLKLGEAKTRRKSLDCHAERSEVVGDAFPRRKASVPGPFPPLVPVIKVQSERSDRSHSSSVADERSDRLSGAVKHPEVGMSSLTVSPGMASTSSFTPAKYPVSKLESHQGDDQTSVSLQEVTDDDESKDVEETKELSASARKEARLQRKHVALRVRIAKWSDDVKASQEPTAGTSSLTTSARIPSATGLRPLKLLNMDDLVIPSFRPDPSKLETSAPPPLRATRCFNPSSNRRQHDLVGELLGQPWRLEKPSKPSGMGIGRGTFVVSDEMPTPRAEPGGWVV